MAFEIARMEARLDADTRGFDKKMRSSEGTFSKVGRNLGKIALGAGAAVGVGLGVVAKVGFDEFAEGSKIAAQTNAVLKSTGGIANITAKQVDSLATSLMKKSGVDDEAIKSGENMLLTFRGVRNEVGEGNDIFNQATGLILDLSVAMGKDMSDSAIMVGKALQDPTRGLTAMRRVGIQFTEAQEEQIKALVESGRTMEAQKMILQELQVEFGGSAEAAGKTLPGQLNILRETFSNVSGEIVGIFMPALGGLASFVGNTVLPQMERFSDFVARIFRQRTLRAKLNVAWEGVRDTVEDLWGQIRDALFGTAAKPIRLDTGKIVEWDTRGTQGLIGNLGVALAGVNWTDIGRRLGSAIGTAIEFGADTLNTMLTGISDWVSSHAQQIAEVGVVIALEMLHTLSDPAFWREHWQLILAVALSLFPIGRFFNLGGRMGAAIGTRFGAVAERLFLKFLQALGHIFDGIPPILREAFQTIVVFTFISTITRYISRFIDWFQHQWNRLPNILQAAFLAPISFVARRIWFVRDAVGEIIAKVRLLIQWIKDLPGKLAGPLGWLSDKAGAIAGFFGGAARAVHAFGAGAGDLGRLALPGGVSGGLVAIGRQLQAMGFQVGENPAFGGVAPVHAQGSYHYQGRAIDINWPGGGSGELVRLKQAFAMLARLPHVELLLEDVGRANQHLHFAMDKAGWYNLKPGLNLVGNYTGRPEPVYATGRGGAPGTVYNFNGPILDGDKLLRFIRSAENKDRRANGGRG